MSETSETTVEMEEQAIALEAIPRAPISNKRAALIMVASFGWGFENAKSTVTKWCKGKRRMSVGHWRTLLLGLETTRQRLALARTLLEGSGLTVVPERHDGPPLNKRDTCREAGDLAVEATRAHAAAAAGVLTRETCREMADLWMGLACQMEDAPDDLEAQAAK